MRFFSRLFFFVSCCALFLSGVHCGSSSSRDTPPPQSDLDAVVGIVIGEAERVSRALQTFNSCEEFQTAITQIPENISCLKGGSLTTTVSNVTCSEGPPVMATLLVTLVSNRCTIESRASSGTLRDDYAVMGEQEMALMAGEKLVIESIELNFADLMVTLQAGTATQCAGRIQVFRNNFCNMAPDCSGCPLE